MAAIIGLDDARLPDLVAQASAHGVFGVANRNSPGQVVVSGERPAIEASLGDRQGARRQARDRAAGLASPPIRRSWRRPPRACADVLAGIAFADPRPPLLANADARADHDRRGLPRRAGRAPDDRRRLGRRGRDDARGRRHHLHRGRAGPRPHGPDQADRPRCRWPWRSTIRRPATASPSRSPTAAAVDGRHRRPPL